jgi:hypothetical protein
MTLRGFEPLESPMEIRTFNETRNLDYSIDKKKLFKDKILRYFILKNPK